MGLARHPRARAPFDKLVEIATHSVALEGRPELLPWRRALAFLASELIGRASRSKHSVAELQTRIVIPLGLELEQEPPGYALGPAELTRRVLAAFEQHSPYDC